MPSLTRFVYEISTEEPYGKEVVARLDERLNSLNDSQIAGLSEHLELSAAKARSRLWREGNEAVWSVARTINEQRIVAFEERTREGRAREEEERLRLLYEKINEDVKVKRRNDIERKALKLATAEVMEHHDRKVIKQKIYNVQFKWKRDQVKYRLYTLGGFLGFLGLLFLLALDPAEYENLGIVLLLIFLFLGTVVIVYGYWRGLAFIKRSKPEQIEEEIESRKDDLVHKMFIRINREEDRARRIEEAEEKIWTMRRAEKKRLKKEARRRERDLEAKARDAREGSPRDAASADPAPEGSLALEFVGAPAAISTELVPAAEEDLEEITLLSNQAAAKDLSFQEEEEDVESLDGGSSVHSEGPSELGRSETVPAKLPRPPEDGAANGNELDLDDEDSLTASISTHRTALTAGTRETRVTITGILSNEMPPPDAATPVMPFAPPGVDGDEHLEQEVGEPERDHVVLQIRPAPGAQEAQQDPHQAPPDLEHHEAVTYTEVHAMQEELPRHPKP